MVMATQKTWVQHWSMLGCHHVASTEVRWELAIWDIDFWVQKYHAGGGSRCSHGSDLHVFWDQENCADFHWRTGCASAEFLSTGCHAEVSNCSPVTQPSILHKVFSGCRTQVSSIANTHILSLFRL